MIAFEKLFAPMLHDIENIRKNEQLVESKENFVKESWEVVVKANKEVTKMLEMIEEKKAELILKQQRAAEIRLQIAALHEELESIAEQEGEIIDKIINPTQEQVDQTESNVVAIGEEISSVKTKIKRFKAQAEDFESQVVYFNSEL